MTIQTEEIKTKETKTESETIRVTATDILRKDVRNGGIASILFGIIWWIPLGIISSVPILVVGGIFLIIEGLLCVLIQRPAMLVLDGLTLISIGALNTAMSGSGFWTLVGGMQVWSGINRIASCRPKAETWLQAGHKYAMQGEFEKAYACYNNALKKNPKLAEDINQLFAIAHNLRGEFLFKNGDMGGAIAEYKQALMINDKLAIAHYNLALALERINKTELALEEFKKYIELDPKGRLSSKVQKAIKRYEQ